MISLRWLINLIFWIFFFGSCTNAYNKDLKELVYEKYRINHEGIILIVDIDRCNTCSSENEWFIKSQGIGKEATLLILSRSRKKAEIFMKFSDQKYIWDSLRIGEPYLKDKMTFIYEKK
ncbi:hypothetical protein Aconfl_09530 [Algoriphagus confluentis]|uniref:Lipoprotein n=1 Tax=Algoriphagus confluentis TaxID=1697556 RepID=A0ABQ6PK18_9BACT|nr:hypothetical protein Aconfl_09530 [Algoriphagus confluentis]